MHKTVFLAALLLPLALQVNAQETLLLWPNPAAADSKEIDTTKDNDQLIAGGRVARITAVTQPSMTVYPAPPAHNTGAAVVVFPGGGYRILAYDLEGTEVCRWLNSIGVTGILLKYRVPDAGPYPEHAEDLADAQRAVRLTREHAAEWKLDANRVGVLGFSAGGHLAAALSNHANEKTYLGTESADQLSALPNFAILIYPGLLRQAQAKDPTQLRSEVVPSAATPPTFLVQAEDDPVHVENTTLYFDALKQAKVPAEMHVFAQGGHGYGLRPTALPVTHWPVLAAQWLHTIGMISDGHSQSD